MALSVSHPVSTRDTNIILRTLARGMILVEDWHGMWYGKSHIILCLSYTSTWESLVLYYELWRRRSHMINIILRGMIKGWWYRYQSRQTNTVVMFFQYYICKFPLFSTKYMIQIYNKHLILIRLNIVLHFLSTDKYII